MYYYTHQIRLAKKDFYLYSKLNKILERSICDRPEWLYEYDLILGIHTASPAVISLFVGFIISSQTAAVSLLNAR